MVNGDVMCLQSYSARQRRVAESSVRNRCNNRLQEPRRYPGNKNVASIRPRSLCTRFTAPSCTYSAIILLSTVRDVNIKALSNCRSIRAPWAKRNWETSLTLWSLIIVIDILILFTSVQIETVRHAIHMLVSSVIRRHLCLFWTQRERGASLAKRHCHSAVQSYRKSEANLFSINSSTVFLPISGFGKKNWVTDFWISLC